MAPGVPVETFDDATASDTGIVADLALHDLWLRHNLQQCLYSVEGAACIAPGYNYLAWSDFQVVAFLLFGDFLNIPAYGSISCLTDNQADR